MRTFQDYYRQLSEQCRKLLARRHAKPALIGLAGLIVLLGLADLGLNFWIRATLRSSLMGTGANSRFSAAVSWLSLPDALAGRIRYARLNATDCRISGLSLTRLDLVNQGFRLDLPLLLRHRTLHFLEVQKTTVRAEVFERALSQYLREHYPEYQLDLNVLPDRVRLTGAAALFGNQLPILLEGEVAPVGRHNIRFFPKRLLVSGRSMGNSFIRLVGDQIPLEFALLPDLPLRITGMRLRPGLVELSWRESPIAAGTEDLP